MADLEKVKTGLECCAIGAECDHCPYSQMNEGKGDYTGCHQLHWDALELLKERQWIPVEERLPKSNEMVLVVGIEAINNENVYAVKYFDGKGFNPFSAPSVLYTHWMPLPKPPKGGEQCGS